MGHVITGHYGPSGGSKTLKNASKTLKNASKTAFYAKTLKNASKT